MKRFLLGVLLGWAFRGPLTSVAIECFRQVRSDVRAAAVQATLGPSSVAVPMLAEPLLEVPATPSAVDRTAPGPIDPATLERLISP